MRKKLSKISILHCHKLVFRSVLLIIATILYIISKINDVNFNIYEKRPILLLIIWGVFLIEMILRFFPSKFESMGCQKQFSKNYIFSETDKIDNNDKPRKHSVFWIIIFWILLNSIFGVLYLFDVIDVGILIIISLIYSVCDMVCILFFCPFQTWFMKNKCCTTCRIYNWDYAMMFTPLVFVKNIFSLSLVVISIVLLIEWEILYRKYPKRFYESTNKSLRCENCKEKLCYHKKQLRSFIKKRINIIRKENKKLH